MQYRAYVNEHMEQFLEEFGMPDDLQDAFEIGLNHEQQHQELMVYDIKHILGINPLAPAYRSYNEEQPTPNLEEAYLEVPADIY